MKKTLATVAALFAIAIAANAQEEEVLYDQYGKRVTGEPLKVQQEDGIFRARGSEYKLWFDSRVQADGAVFFGQQDWADPIGNGINMRRVRFAVKTQVTKDWYGEVDVDFANGAFELKDAIIRYDGIPNMEIQLGNFKEFFSIQRNNSSRYLQFMERPMVSQCLAPSRHLGLNAKYAKDAIWASAGIFFQEIEGQETRTFSENNNKLTNFDTDEGISLTGKFVWMPGFDKENWGLHIAAAASYRQPKTSAEIWGYNRYSTRNNTSVNRKKYIDTGDFGMVDFSTIYTAELAGYWGGFRGEAAYIGNTTLLKNAPELGGKAKNFGGWYVQGGYLLFGGKQHYDSNGAKFNRVTRGQNWGDVELCGRVEQIDLNADKAYWDAATYEQAGKLIMGGSAMAFSIGINYYINNNVKFVLDYQYTDNDMFASGKSNKFFVGRDGDGNATRDPRKVDFEKTGDMGGINYHMVSTRLEINF